MEEEPGIGISAITEEKGTEEEKETVDSDLFCCLLQPWSSDVDPDYVAIRRLLLHRKALSGTLRRRVSLCHCL